MGSSQRNIGRKRRCLFGKGLWGSCVIGMIDDDDDDLAWTGMDCCTPTAMHHERFRRPFLLHIDEGSFSEFRNPTQSRIHDCVTIQSDDDRLLIHMTDNGGANDASGDEWSIESGFPRGIFSALLFRAIALWTTGLTAERDGTNIVLPSSASLLGQFFVEYLVESGYPRVSHARADPCLDRDSLMNQYLISWLTSLRSCAVRSSWRPSHTTSRPSCNL